jgi:hypothetical protein
MADLSEHEKLEARKKLVVGQIDAQRHLVTLYAYDVEQQSRSWGRYAHIVRRAMMPIAQIGGPLAVAYLAHKRRQRALPALRGSRRSTSGFQQKRNWFKTVTFVLSMGWKAYNLYRMRNKLLRTRVMSLT